MDNTELHFLTFDSDEMWREMMEIYAENGGEVPYPGDEKEMLLRGVQAILIQGFAAMDTAMRMGTLRYASGEYLDLLGENRGCERREAERAKAKVAVRFRNGAGSVAAGEKITEDGKIMYTFDIGGSTSTDEMLLLDVTAEEAGESGNSLKADARLQTVSGNDSVLAIICEESAAGGTDTEDDESYRERIREFGLTNNTTGPKMQYEKLAKEVSPDVYDAEAIRGSNACDVNVYLLLADGSDEDTLIAQVEAALSDYNRRPLTDNVTAIASESIPYTLNVKYRTKPGSNIAEQVAEAIADYQSWQDRKIGEAFNPDSLMAAIYNAGATRVIWGTGSKFNGGTVEYTEIDAKKYCKGTITAEVMA